MDADRKSFFREHFIGFRPTIKVNDVTFAGAIAKQHKVERS